MELAYGLAQDERLACQATVTADAQDIEVYVRAASEFTILTESVEGTVPLDPLAHRADDRVVLEGVHARSVAPYRGDLLGLALDVGTTTMVAQVLDLQTGQTFTTMACKNPQAVYGDDVISRIGYTMQHEDGLDGLQTGVVEALNVMLADSQCRGPSAFADRIYEAVVVGNPTMRDLFFAHNVHSLDASPLYLTIRMW